MTAIANVGQIDMLRRHLQIFVGTETPKGISQVFGDGSRKLIPNDELDEMPRPTLTLPEEEARALLSALLRHFEGGDDLRALRKDYDAERGRVDKLTDALVGIAKAQPVVISQ